MAKRNLCWSFASITIFLLVLSPLIVIIKVQNLGALALTSYSDRNFGGSGLDDGKAVVQTGDGGFALSGTTQSFGNGNSDLWLIRIDSNFDTIWNQTYGGPEDELGGCVIATNDGGFALVGYTKSYGSGDFDFWLVKTDANGNIQWSQTYGGSGFEKVGSAIQTVDGGYVIVGAQYPSSAGNLDFLIVKTDSEGVEQWSQTYGGAYWDEATSVIQTNDGGFLIAGYTYSFGADPGLTEDFWLVKTNSAGDMEWSETYGGVANDRAQCVIQTQDGGFAILGYSYSYGSGENDFWLVKTNSRGDLEWSETYGGSERDMGFSVVETIDGGFVMVGYSSSVGVKSDFWIVKTDAFGTVQRTQSFGGGSFDEAYSVVETIDGGFVLVGSTNSFGEGGDFWLVKTDSALSPLPTPEPTLLPTQPPPPPLSSEIEWENSYGPLSGNDVVQTSDGGYAIVGETASYRGYERVGWENYAAALVKVDSNGNLQWKKNFSEGRNFFSVLQTDNQGYVLIGVDRNRSLWVVKTGPNGEVEWDRTFFEGNDWVEVIAIKTTSGVYALAGYVRPPETGHYSAIFMEIDKNGNSLWQKTYTEDGSFSSVVESDDGGFVLAGTRGNGGDSWLVKIDSSGELVWDRTYSDYPFQSTVSVSKTGDGGYILSGWSGPENRNTGTADGLLVKVDENGYVQWHKSYEIFPHFIRIEQSSGSSHQIYEQFFSQALQTNDGGYIVAGSVVSVSGIQGSGRFALIAKVDSYGDLVDYMTYNFSVLVGNSRYQLERVLLESLIPTDDGGFAFTGSKRGNGLPKDDNIFLVKLVSEPFSLGSITPDSGGLGDDLSILPILLISFVAFGFGIVLLIYYLKRE